MDANLYLVKAYQRRMVAINAHCLRNFPLPKPPKRKPVKRKDFAEGLRELILASEHPHVFYHEDTQKWHCTHCPMVLRTFPLYEHLRRTKACPKMLGVLGQQQRLDRPLPLFMQGPVRQEGPQPPPLPYPSRLGCLALLCCHLLWRGELVPVGKAAPIRSSYP